MSKKSKKATKQGKKTAAQFLHESAAGETNAPAAGTNDAAGETEAAPVETAAPVATKSGLRTVAIRITEEELAALHARAGRGKMTAFVKQLVLAASRDGFEAETDVIAVLRGQA